MVVVFDDVNNDVEEDDVVDDVMEGEIEGNHIKGELVDEIRSLFLCFSYPAQTLTTANQPLTTINVIIMT